MLGTFAKGIFMRVFLLEHTPDELPTPENAKILTFPSPRRRTEYLLGPLPAKKNSVPISPPYARLLKLRGVPEVESCHDNPFERVAVRALGPGWVSSVATAAGVHPATLARWVAKGPPPEPAWEALSRCILYRRRELSAAANAVSAHLAGLPVELPPELPLVPTADLEALRRAREHGPSSRTRYQRAGTRMTSIHRLLEGGYLEPLSRGKHQYYAITEAGLDLLARSGY